MSKQQQSKQSVYDLPTRIFHWLFVIFFLIAFTIAKTIDDEAPAFSYHMIAGLILGFLVFLRTLWGFVGTKHARFSGFALNPRHLLSYLKGIATGSKKRWAGHNPASSWAAITMMALTVGLGITGYLMTSGPNKEFFEDVHELLANGFIIVVLFHVAGIALHTVRHREMIGLSMINGKKSDVASQEAISSTKPVWGLLLLGLVIAFSFYLVKNYNNQTRTLQFFGATLQLNENEGSENGAKARENEDEDDHDDD